MSRNPNHLQIKSNGRTTHVVVPSEEYDKLVEAALERAMKRVEAQIADPNTPYYDGQSLLDELHDTGTIEDLANHRVKPQPKPMEAGPERVESLAAARKSRGLTQKALGALLGVPQSQISRIERHPERSSLAMLQRIAAALNMDVRQLI